MLAHPAPAAAHRRFLVALGVMALLALSALLFAWNRAVPETAQAADAGSTVAMELKVPATVVVGKKFTIGISANLTPAEPIWAFGAEVLTSDALKYSGANCLAEVKVRRKDQGSLFLCNSFASVAGGRGLTVMSAPTFPLPSLDVPVSSQADLANLSYTCNTVGIQKFTLTAAPHSPDGAAFGTTSNTLITVKTVLLDGTPVADSAVINCLPPRLGDVNCDGVVSIADAQLIAQKIVGRIDTLACPNNANVDQSGGVTIADAQLIAQLIVGRIPSLPSP